jgi:hypothetical protein
MSGEFNHVQFAVDEALAQGENVASLEAFFELVLGWKRFGKVGPGALVFTASNRTQYLVLKIDSDPAKLNSEDHVGLSYTEPGELARIRDAAMAFRRRDERLEIADFNATENNALKISGFRLNYLLPFGIEIGLHEYADEEPRHMFSRIFDE